jgi:membrane protein DedA with SNARE-associated domain
LALALILLVLLICGLGLPLPEEIPIIAIGYFTYTGDVRLSVAIVLTILAILGGDSGLYFIGRRYGNRIFEVPPFKTLVTPNRMKKANHYFHKYGNGVVFMGRFIAGVRATIFLTAGILRMPYRRFITLDGLAALISIPLNIWIVHHALKIFGEEIDLVIDSMRRAGRTLMLALLVLVVVGSVYLYVRRRLAKVRRARSIRAAREKALSDTIPY